MKYHGVTRRHFLQGTAGFSLALPLMPSLMSKAHAAYFPGTKYFVAMSTEHGAVVPENYFPAGALNQSELLIPGNPANGTEHRISWNALDSMVSTTTNQWNPSGNPELSPILGSFLNPYLDQLNILRGLDVMWYISHHSGGYLGNFHAGDNVDLIAQLNFPAMPTIDQVIANSSNFYGVGDTRALRSVNLNTGQGISWGYSGQSVIRLPQSASSSQALFTTLFGSGGGGGGGGSVNPDLSVVDAVLEDYNRLNSSAFGPGRRLSSEDRNRLNRHVQALRELEVRLENQSSGGGGCSAQAPGNNEEFTWGLRDFDEVADEWRAFIDVTVMGMKCGATRVATLGAWSHTEYSGDYHQDIAHNPFSAQGSAELVNSYRFVAEHIFGYLVSQLDEEITPGGATYLDNALVTWQMEHGELAHSTASMPMVTAGSAGGFFHTGRYVDYRNYANVGLHAWGNTTEYPGVPMNRWLRTVLDSMGVQPSEYKTGAFSSMLGYGDSFEDGPNHDGHVCYPSNLIASSDDPMPVIVAP